MAEPLNREDLEAALAPRDQKIDTLDQKLDALDQRVDLLEKKVDANTAALSVLTNLVLDTRTMLIDEIRRENRERNDRVDGRFDSMDDLRRWSRSRCWSVSPVEGRKANTGGGSPAWNGTSVCGLPRRLVAASHAALPASPRAAFGVS
jgi:hypothetical protein